ncbi:MAG: ABC transporter permease [Verrucomicrobiota bacterium]
MRHALRSLARSPCFTAVALLTLALSIGACTAIFSIVNSILLRPSAYPGSERLVVLQESKPPEYPIFAIAPANYLDWAAQTTDIFEGSYAWHSENFTFTADGAEPAHVEGFRTTGQFFQVLGATPLLGQVFGPEHDVPARSRVVVLGHAFWQKHLGARRDIVGETIRINGWSLTVLGVMPETFQRERPGRYAFYTPLALEAGGSDSRGDHYLASVARLKPGIDLAQARARLAVVASRLAVQYPDTNKGWTIVATSLLEHETASSRTTLYTLLGAVATLLLIACANLANLLLARATARHRELSVRAALGASRSRLVRALLAESLILAVAGGALGILIGGWALDALLAIAPPDLPRAAEIALDGRAIAVTIGLTFLTVLLFGLAPALHASRVDLVSALQDGSRTSSDGRQRRFLRQTLVVVEIALALALLAGAGLLMRSFTRLLAFDPGFVAQGGAMAQVTVPFRKYNTPAKQEAFAARVGEHIRALPGVTQAAVTSTLPMADNGHVSVVERPAQELRPNELPVAGIYAVSPDYLGATGIRLLRGRAFTAHDKADAPLVALISQSAAEKLFPGLDPLGQRVQPGIGRPPRWCEIVGIVSDVKHHGIVADTPPQLYTPFAQSPWQMMTFVVRTSGDVAALLPALRRAVLAVDPEQPIGRLEPLPQLLSDSIARQRFALILFGVFSGAALLLAALGIYGVMAYSVARRTGEFGIRIALGAQHSDLARLVLAQALRLIGLGIACGTLLALFATHAIASLLYHTPATDPLVFGTVALLLALVATLACYLPARRAARTDPMTALRTE